MKRYEKLSDVPKEELKDGLMLFAKKQKDAWQEYRNGWGWWQNIYVTTNIIQAIQYWTGVYDSAEAMVER